MKKRCTCKHPYQDKNTERKSVYIIKPQKVGDAQFVGTKKVEYN